MNRIALLLLLLAFAACKNATKEKTADNLPKEEMPAAVQKLYNQAAAHPDSVGLRLLLIDALDSAGAGKRALSEIDSLIHKDSLNYGFWYRKALLQQNYKDTTGALRSFRYAIRIYPSPDALLAAANLLAEKKDSTALLLARQVLSQRIGREYDAHSYFISGIYYARSYQAEKALNAFNACIANDYTYPEAYMEKGFIYYESRQYKEAAGVFQILTRIRNTYPDGFYWLAKCQEALGNKDAAIANYRRSLTLDPDLREATIALQRLKK